MSVLEETTIQLRGHVFGVFLVWFFLLLFFLNLRLQKSKQKQLYYLLPKYLLDRRRVGDFVKEMLFKKEEWPVWKTYTNAKIADGERNTKPDEWNNYLKNKILKNNKEKTQQGEGNERTEDWSTKEEKSPLLPFTDWWLSEGVVLPVTSNLFPWRLVSVWHGVFARGALYIRYSKTLFTYTSLANFVSVCTFQRLIIGHCYFKDK